MVAHHVLVWFNLYVHGSTPLTKTEAPLLGFCFYQHAAATLELDRFLYVQWTHTHI